MTKGDGKIQFSQCGDVMRVSWARTPLTPKVLRVMGYPKSDG